MPPMRRIDIGKLHGVNGQAIRRAEKALLKKLNGEELGPLDKLKRLTIEMGENTIASLRSQMDEREIAILERRVKSPEPEDFTSMGETFSISRERMRQVQSMLYLKLRRYKETGRFELPENFEKN